MTAQNSLPWIGEFKAEWKIIPNKALIRKKKVSVGLRAGDYDLLSLTKQGVIVRNLDEGGKFPENFDSYQRVQPGDLVTCLFDVEETPRTIGIAKNAGMITGAYDVFEFTDHVNPRFFEYFYLALDQRKGLKYFYTGLRNVIKTPTFLGIPMPLPPREEQDAIVEFLDKELASLDHSIEKLIELKNKVSEFRRASIVQAVQLGLESNPDTEPGPEPYLPKVRKDWGFGALKRFAEFGSGSGFPETDQGIETEEIPFLKVNALGQAAKDGLISVRTDTVSRSTAKRLGAAVFPAGSLVMAKIGAALLLGRVGVLSEPSCVDNNMMVVIPKSSQHPRFYYYMLQTLEFSSFVNPGAVPSTSGTAVGRQVVSNVPYAAQKSISDHLDAICETLDALSNKIEGSLDLLNERRSALISAAVTGKLDLQGETDG